MFARLLSSAFFVYGLSVPTLFAQSQDSPPPPASSTAPPASSNTAPVASSPKKIWTNEDVSGTKSGISVVGDKRNLNYHLTPAQSADPATVDRIKKNLPKLQSQLDEVNSKLKSYKQFQDGDPVSKGERDMSKGYSRTPVDQQMVQLLDKKKQLESQIGDLLDEARKKGIDPGQLR
jgi:hypothetical protein